MGGEYPRPVRALVLAVLLAAATLGGAQAPRRGGSYAPVGGKAASWRIDDNHSLVWNDARYTPVGVRVDGTAGAVDAANAAGVKDLLIDLAVGSEWNAAIQAAEKNGQRYLVRIGSLAPGATGVEIDPAAYRVAGLTGAKHLDLPLPGATDALVIVALQRDASIVSKEVVPVRDGRLLYDTRINAGLDNVVLIYPRTEGLELPDLWERMDAHRDALLARLRSAPFGLGLRGIVDPLGRTAALPGADGPRRTDLARLPGGVGRGAGAQVHHGLERDGRLVDGGIVALDGRHRRERSNRPQDHLSRSRAARPSVVRREGRVPALGPGKNKFYGCAKEKSRIWEDIDEAIVQAASRRVQRLCDGIRRVVDVPIVQEWTRLVGPYRAARASFRRRGGARRGRYADRAR